MFLSMLDQNVVSEDEIGVNSFVFQNKRITIDLKTESKFSLYNLNEEVIHSKMIGLGKSRINLSHLSMGKYMALFENEKGLKSYSVWIMN